MGIMYGPPFSQVKYNEYRALTMCMHCSGMFWADDHTTLDSHTLFHQGLKENGNMSKVAWCDKGNHPFKAGEPGSQSGTMNVVDEYGRTQSIDMDTCAEHAFQVPTAKEIPAPNHPQDYR